VARQFYEAATARNQFDSRITGEEMRARVSQADRKANEVAGDLSRMLLLPVRSRLTKRRLLVVATGALQFIPFAALPVPVTNSQAANSRPLIENHEIIVLPSVTALAVIREGLQNRVAPPKQVVVLGDPVFDEADGRVRGKLNRPAGLRSEFPRLFSSRWEGEQIVSLVPRGEGKLVVDFAANQAFASSPEVSGYRIVHFATHAIIDLKHPAASGIVLSMVDQDGKPQDGFLSLDEIFKLKLPVDLVVLSACRTALGKDYAGEGLVGLTRGFMNAGASRVAVSLWQVPDKATSELMVRFYKQMLGPKKLSPSAALRAAQLELRKDPRWHSSYYWAPFILQGEWR
jgi:CHAT domain-containing protein